MNIEVTYSHHEFITKEKVRLPQLPLHIEFTLENGNKFRVNCVEDRGMLAVYCDSQMVIHPVSANMIRLEERGF